MASFEQIIRIHQARYPQMQPQDFGKLAYQSEFGPEHLITDERAAAEGILREWQTVSGSGVTCNPEPIGNGLCRFHLTDAYHAKNTARDLAKLMAQSAREHMGTSEGLLTRLNILRQLPVDGMEAWLDEYQRRGCPPVHHSETFRCAYHPHYRVVCESLAGRFPALLRACRE